MLGPARTPNRYTDRFAPWRLRAARLPLRTLCWWLASVAAFGARVAVFDDLVYGGPLTTGYQPGEVTFSLGAIEPNPRIMPAALPLPAR
jgi:hypothetical protein